MTKKVEVIEQEDVTIENEELEVWSIDDGFGDLKADNGKEVNGGEIAEDEELNQWEYLKRTGVLLMPTHIMLDVDKRDAGMGNDPDIDPLSYVRVKYNKRRYIVGFGAVQQDENAKWIGEENKHGHMFFPVLMATVLGLLATQEKTMVDLLIMGLPVNAEKDPDRHELLRSLILNKWHETEITLANGQVLKRKVTVNDLEIKSQPFGSFCSLLLNKNGTYKNRELVNQTTTIADIGTKTFNVCTLTKNFEILEKLTHNTNDGMMEAYKRINQDIFEELGYEVVEGKLSETMKEGVVDTYNLTESKEFHYELQAQIVSTELNKMLTNSAATVNNIAWTGGGTEATKKWLPSKMDKRLTAKKIYYLDRFATARGLRSFGMLKKRIELSKQKVSS